MTLPRHRLPLTFSELSGSIGLGRACAPFALDRPRPRPGRSSSPNRQATMMTVKVVLIV